MKVTACVREWENERERKKTESECKTESVISVSNLLYYIHIHMLTHMRHSKWTNEPEHIVWSRNRLHKNSILFAHGRNAFQNPIAKCMVTQSTVLYGTQTMIMHSPVCACVTHWTVLFTVFEKFSVYFYKIMRKNLNQFKS